jgi:aspartyl-tRNA(Asn)/glutamyl-tRNA(Gln) amidotransferase subunit A
MSTDFIYSDATKLAELIRTREVSSVEVVQAHLDRIEATNPKINAVVTLADAALDAAKAADEALSAGVEVGPLHGVPFTVRTRSTPPGRSRSAARRSSRAASRTMTPPASRA